MSIYDFTLNELEKYLKENGIQKYRALQIFSWLYDKKVTSFDEMTDLNKPLIEKLKLDFKFMTIDIIEENSDKETKKYLFSLCDNNYIEAVVMMHDYGYSLCISSQVGCNMGCKFCESGRLKKKRNLTSGEMVMQIVKITNHIGVRISHIVIMGIGEPFDNYENVTKFIEIINNPKGLAIGSRHITVSTCGIIPKIKEFANFPLQVNLAISLHAPNNEIRDMIMPINKIYKIEELIKAIKEYIKITNRRVTFEYIMLDKINDSEKCAKELCSLIRGMNAYINLIPYNESSNILYKRSNKILEFYDIIKKENINVTIRREFGSTIKAACGQLRSIKESKEE